MTAVFKLLTHVGTSLDEDEQDVSSSELKSQPNVKKLRILLDNFLIYTVFSQVIPLNSEY